MSTERSLVLSLILVVALLSLLKVEKLVRMSFWSYLLLAWSLALGTGILQGASLLQSIPDETFLGLRCARIYHQCSADYTPHIFCGRATILYPIRTLKHQNLFRNFWKKTPNFASMCFKFLKSDFLLLFFPCIFQRRFLRTNFYATDGSSLCCTNSYDWLYISDY